MTAISQIVISNKDNKSEIIIKEQKKYDLYRSFFFRDVVQVNNADEIITDKLALCSGSICCL